MTLGISGARKIYFVFCKDIIFEPVLLATFSFHGHIQKDLQLLFALLLFAGQTVIWISPLYSTND